MNMKRSILAVLSAVLFAGVVWAAVPWTTINNASWVKSKFYVGPAATVTTTANHVTKALGGRVDFTFSALGNDGGTIACETAHITGTATGATFGDPCFVGVGFGATPIITSDLVTSEFSCFVSTADVVKIRRCGGQSAPALSDAGYSFRVISSQ